MLNIWIKFWWFSGWSWKRREQSNTGQSEKCVFWSISMRKRYVKKKYKRRPPAHQLLQANFKQIKRKKVWINEHRYHFNMCLWVVKKILMILATYTHIACISFVYTFLNLHQISFSFGRFFVSSLIRHFSLTIFCFPTFFVRKKRKYIQKLNE